MEAISSVLPEILTAIISAFVAWFFARKKNEAEANSLELDNVDKAIAIWRKLAQDLEAKIALLTKKIEELEKQDRACADCPHIKS